ncbi:MAG: hypothetical protein OXI96_02960, partial [Acidimicrobiaceae bacterium]|nr:hypothetical protein [Acidimicrobiaceae bacterium]
MDRTIKVLEQDSCRVASSVELQLGVFFGGRVLVGGFLPVIFECGSRSVSASGGSMWFWCCLLFWLFGFGGFIGFVVVVWW